MNAADGRRAGDAGKPDVDARTLWAGGAATALVAALTAVVGVLVVRGVFDVHVLAPEEAGVWGDVSTTALAVAAAAAALVATGLLHLLLLTTPRARSFFSWIMVLATAAATVAPFATDADLSTQVGSAIIYLAIGTAIGTLLTGVARAARGRRPA